LLKPARGGIRLIANSLINYLVVLAAGVVWGPLAEVLGAGHCCPFGSGCVGACGAGGTLGKYNGPLTPHPERVIEAIMPKNPAKFNSLATMIFILIKQTLMG
jgi:hypothetical protein